MKTINGRKTSEDRIENSMEMSIKIIESEQRLRKMDPYRPSGQN